MVRSPSPCAISLATSTSSSTGFVIDRFTKRTAQLSARAAEVKEAHDEYHRIQKDLTRLEGSLQAIEYLAYGKLPGDGNHDGMRDHKPQ